MRILRPFSRPFSRLVLLLGIVGWSFACGDTTTEPSLPADPAELERAVLRILYDATGGGEWTQSDNWLSAAPLGEWHGVTVAADGRVVGVRLPDNNLKGQIPPELGSLPSLEGLNLGRNDLSGGIPPQLGRLSSLTELFLHSNSLSGQIPPQLGDLPALEALYLSYNDLTGGIPPELAGLSSLRALGLYNNELTGRSPPSSPIFLWRFCTCPPTS